MTDKIKYRKYFKALEFLCLIVCIVGLSSKNHKYANYALFSFLALWVLLSLENLYRIYFYPEVKINKGGDVSFIAMQPYILWYVTYGIRFFFKDQALDSRVLTVLTVLCYIVLALSFVVIYIRFIKGNYVNFFNFRPKKAEIPELKKSIYKCVLSLGVLVYAIYLRFKGLVDMNQKPLMIFSYLIFIVSLGYYNGLVSKKERSEAKAQKAEPFLIGIGVCLLFLVNPILFL